MYRGVAVNHRRSAPPRIYSEKTSDFVGSKRDERELHDGDVDDKESPTSSSATPLNTSINAPHYFHSYPHRNQNPSFLLANPLKRSSLPSPIGRSPVTHDGSGIDRDQRSLTPAGNGGCLWSERNGDDSIVPTTANRGTSPLRVAVALLIVFLMLLAIASFAAGAYHRTQDVRHVLDTDIERHRDLEHHEPLLKEMSDDEEERSVKADSDQMAREQDELSDLHDQLRAAENALKAERGLLQISSSGSPQGPPIDLDDQPQHELYQIVSTDSPEEEAQRSSGTSTKEDSVVRRLITTIGADQYGEGPIWVELHLEYSVPSYFGGRSRTTILRRYVTAQISLADRPVTSFVFLRQIQHGMHRHVPLVILGGANDDGSYDDLSGQVFMKEQVPDDLKKKRLALGLAWIPVREDSTEYIDPLLEEFDHESGSTLHKETAHYHLGLDEQGGLFVTSKSTPRSIHGNHGQGIFATVVRGESVLDELIELHQRQFPITHKQRSSVSKPPIQAHIVAIRFLTLLEGREVEGGLIDDEFARHDEF